jgi:F-type H+-transporting ATPase subunit c
MKYINSFIFLLISVLIPVLAFAEDSGSSNGIGALAPGIAFGLAAIGGTFGQAKAISAFMDAAGRNPGAAGNLRTNLIVGLVFIETLVLFGLVVAILLK